MSYRYYLPNPANPLQGLPIDINAEEYRIIHLLKDQFIIHSQLALGPNRVFCTICGYRVPFVSGERFAVHEWEAHKDACMDANWNSIPPEGSMPFLREGRTLNDTIIDSLEARAMTGMFSSRMYTLLEIAKHELSRGPAQDLGDIDN